MSHAGKPDGGCAKTEVRKERGCVNERLRPQPQGQL